MEKLIIGRTYIWHKRICNNWQTISTKYFQSFRCCACRQFPTNVNCSRSVQKENSNSFC